MSNSSEIPVPNAVIIIVISSFSKILFGLAFSTFSIFPLNGNTAWKFLFLPILQLPPAESPSTMKSSVFAGSLSEQSASFPGSECEFKAPFLLVSSLAFAAASLAFAEFTHFPIINFAIPGFSSMNIPKFSLTRLSTMPLTSEFPSFVFVWPSNCGSGSCIEITALNPSLASSLESFTSLTFNFSA